MDGCRRQSDHDASARSHRVNEHAIWRHAKGDICREIARAALCGMTGAGRYAPFGFGLSAGDNGRSQALAIRAAQARLQMERRPNDRNRADFL